MSSELSWPEASLSERLQEMYRRQLPSGEERLSSYYESGRGYVAAVGAGRRSSRHVPATTQLQPERREVQAREPREPLEPAAGGDRRDPRDAAGPAAGRPRSGIRDRALAPARSRRRDPWGAALA